MRCKRTKRKIRSYTVEFKKEAVALVTEQGYSVSKAAESLGITDKLLYNWKAKFEVEQSGVSLNIDEKNELLKLRKKLMTQLNLVVTQRIAYKVTTKRKHSDAVADNLLNQNSNPMAPNQVWAGDVTYLKTGEGWMYLAIVMDLYSRRIVGWHIDKRMTTDLVSKAMTKAHNLRQPAKGLVFHSDRGSQYTSKSYRNLLTRYSVRASMGAVGACWCLLVPVGACWDNAVVERFFGSLKQDWLFKIPQLTTEHMKSDVTEYMRYYNVKRLHTANKDMSPIEYEISYGNSLRKVP